MCMIETNNTKKSTNKMPINKQLENMIQVCKNKEIDLADTYTNTENLIKKLK